jgi:hypothetical protein
LYGKGEARKNKLGMGGPRMEELCIVKLAMALVQLAVALR